MSEQSDPKSLSENADGVYQEGDFENAARLYGEAASAFQAQGNLVTAAEMKNNQSVSFLQAGNAQAAYDAAAGTSEVFATAADPRRQGIALANEATALEAWKRIDEALEKYLQSADAFKQADEDQLRASVLQAVAWITLRRGKLFEALNYLRSSVENLKNPTLKQKITRGLLKLRLW
jgi:ATP/maltotriose-dependent transcriptional regulator MalT